jgi:hypothetical protein
MDANAQGALYTITYYKELKMNFYRQDSLL